MSKQPNVIFVLTDDQGYADLGCTGNPWIHTPNIDAFYEESVRFCDFHVSPLCTPTRGALLTGHRPIRNGAWATCWGRSILRRSEVTMADVFENSGYRTGMFGKWHLGDNYPYRPQDRGFQHVVAHKGGGVGQTPDFWGNNYFDDTYFHNGEAQEHDGYCTDIWFEEAKAFITECKDESFFAYIATNAPHSPYLVADKYKARYVDNPDIPEPAFYGMIENIDENFGKLDAFLKEQGLHENTILIFMTDNGSSGGCTLDENDFVERGYNAGMRGKKFSYYDGGHRVPFFVRWPANAYGGGRDISEMTLHVDVLPTFIDICGLKSPEGVEFDGQSLGPLLRGEGERFAEDRVHFLQIRQHTDPPEQWNNAVMTRQWRLIGGKELYDITADPGQHSDVADQHPEIVQRLHAAHESWWAEISPALAAYPPISLGNETENPTRLDAMDVMGDVAWNQQHIATAKQSTGKWTVDVEQIGTYKFSLRRWPEELELPIEASISQTELERLAPYEGKAVTCRTLNPSQAQLILFGVQDTLPVDVGMKEVSFTRQTEQTGVTELEAWFVDGNGEKQGAYYVYVERI